MARGMQQQLVDRMDAVVVGHDGGDQDIAGLARSIRTTGDFIRLIILFECFGSFGIFQKPDRYTPQFGHMAVINAALST